MGEILSQMGNGQAHSHDQIPNMFAVTCEPLNPLEYKTVTLTSLL